MLAKNNRIKFDKDFDQAFKFGQSFYDKLIGVKSVDNNLGVNRFGILVSTKVSKKATVRNLIKRRIRSIIKEELEKMKTGKDLVIIVLPPILDKNFTDIRLSLKSGFSRLKLYN
ncbi:MAG: ribonuclease P protein component [Patescibacteria group bacterium]